MYEIVTLRDKIRVEPKSLGADYKKAIEAIIRKDYTGKIVEDKMLFVGLVSIDSIEEGLIIPNDASVYYDTIFKMLAYAPLLHETVKGQVSNISEIGALVNIGPIDGLTHISQAMDDFVDFTRNALIGRKTKLSLKVGDSVLAGIIAVSTKGIMKVGLTMRSPGLGKLGTKKKDLAVKGKKKE
ncbi:MAG: DNA-directed RNA polymerase [Candidatus Parvarchaeota archaeon]|nr:DNA-directed RNA polymerase [Candidatus Parvarchaeota archaeon]